MKKREIYILFGAICMILVFAISIQIKSIRSTTDTVSQTWEEDSLRDEVLKIKEKYDNMYVDLEKAEKNLEEIRAKVAEEDGDAKQTEEELKLINNLLGLTELTGQGVIVTLNDNQSVSSETIGVLETIEQYLVHDEDILRTINELRNAGAEAISVNGHRITATTAIVCIGNVVSINDERVGAPYVINAIGQPESLYGALTRPESFLQILNRDGVITEVKKSNNIIVPKYTGTYNFEHIKNQK